MKILDELEAELSSVTLVFVESRFPEDSGKFSVDVVNRALPALIRVARAAECMYERNIYTVELEDALQRLRDLGGKE